MNFNIVNLGCKVNRVESDAFAAGLLARGCVESDGAADVVVVNTCTVTGEAEKKTRKAVRRALRDNPTAQVVVTGCAAAIDADTYLSMDPQRVHLAGKLEVDQLLDELVGPLGHGAQALAVGEGFHTRVGVKVQDGCNNACTYCIVHVARGRATSRNAEEVRAECVALARAGVREIVLTGINLGSYRWVAEAASPADDVVGASGTSGEPALVGAADPSAPAANPPASRPTPLRLDGLLRLLLADTADIHEPGEPACRFRISSIEPRDVSDDLIALMAAADGRICRHLHLPLQSGSTKVLREMHRPYTAQRFCALVEKLYEAMPQLSLSTDIICGFPGETEDEFAETLELARACRFTKIHVFPYSPRRGTPAAERADQVAPEVRAERAARLRALADELRAADFARRRGTVELALVEESGVAMTESYYELPAPAADGEVASAQAAPAGTPVPGSALDAVSVPAPPAAPTAPAPTWSGAKPGSLVEVRL